MRTTLSLTAIIEEWLDSTDAALTTKKDYGRKVRLWFRWLSAQGVDPRNPSRQDILRWKEALHNEGKSVFTVNGYITVIKIFYRWCSQVNYCENIGAGIKSSLRMKEHYKLPLTRAQCNELLSSIPTDNLVGARDRFIILLMLSNGLRVCEVERANIGDFDTLGGRNILHIQRKGRPDKHDVVAVPDEVMDALEDYISLRTDDCKMESPLVVNCIRGREPKRMLKGTISAIVKKRMMAIGISDPKITAHSLRHTCGSLMVEEGVPIETIQDVLGHNDPATTRIYVDMARHRQLIRHSPSEFIAKIITKKSSKNAKD